MDELIDVSIVGEPVVYGAAFIALLLVAFTWAWADLVLSTAHEGGHMVAAVLTFRGFRSWRIIGTGNASTTIVDGSWGPGDFIVTLAGYLAPPLLGLGGATVLADGNAWGILVIAAILFFGAFLYAREGLANVVTLVGLAGVLLLLWRGSTYAQLTVAAGLVWLMLLGGVRDAVSMGRTGGADAAIMAKRTWIPALVWQTGWVLFALAALYAGGRLLLVGDAWPDGVWPFDVPAEA